MVYFDRHAWAPDSPGNRQVRPLTQEARFQQCDDLAVHRRDAQRRRSSNYVPTDRTTQTHGPEDGRSRGIGQVQRRRHDVTVRSQLVLAAGLAAE
ncbi:Uncharacterised protein [Mycobacterium tuberculosis]|nr:Uncharacterised protein [Mycobacterium tuberculosis]